MLREAKGCRCEGRRRFIDAKEGEGLSVLRVVGVIWSRRRFGVGIGVGENGYRCEGESGYCRMSEGKKGAK